MQRVTYTIHVTAWGYASPAFQMEIARYLSSYVWDVVEDPQTIRVDVEFLYKKDVAPVSIGLARVVTAVRRIRSESKDAAFTVQTPAIVDRSGYITLGHYFDWPPGTRSNER